MTTLKSERAAIVAALANLQAELAALEATYLDTLATIERNPSATTDAAGLVAERERLALSIQAKHAAIVQIDGEVQAAGLTEREAQRAALRRQIWATFEEYCALVAALEARPYDFTLWAALEDANARGRALDRQHGNTAGINWRFSILEVADDWLAELAGVVHQHLFSRSYPSGSHTQPAQTLAAKLRIAEDRSAMAYYIGVHPDHTERSIEP